jgi:hypothetical protein
LPDHFLRHVQYVRSTHRSAHRRTSIIIGIMTIIALMKWK